MNYMTYNNNKNIFKQFTSASLMILHYLPSTYPGSILGGWVKIFLKHELKIHNQ